MSQTTVDRFCSAAAVRFWADLDMNRVSIENSDIKATPKYALNGWYALIKNES